MEPEQNTEPVAQGQQVGETAAYGELDEQDNSLCMSDVNKSGADDGETDILFPHISSWAPMNPLELEGSPSVVEKIKSLKHSSSKSSELLDTAKRSEKTAPVLLATLSAPQLLRGALQYQKVYTLGPSLVEAGNMGSSNQRLTPSWFPQFEKVVYTLDKNALENASGPLISANMIIDNRAKSTGVLKNKLSATNKNTENSGNSGVAGAESSAKRDESGGGGGGKVEVVTGASSRARGAGKKYAPRVPLQSCYKAFSASGLPPEAHTSVDHFPKTSFKTAATSNLAPRSRDTNTNLKTTINFTQNVISAHTPVSPASCYSVKDQSKGYKRIVITPMTDELPHMISDEYQIPYNNNEIDLPNTPGSNLRRQMDCVNVRSYGNEFSPAVTIAAMTDALTDENSADYKFTRFPRYSGEQLQKVRQQQQQEQPQQYQEQQQQVHTYEPLRTVPLSMLSPVPVNLSNLQSKLKKPFSLPPKRLQEMTLLEKALTQRKAVGSVISAEQVLIFIYNTGKFTCHPIT